MFFVCPPLSIVPTSATLRDNMIKYLILISSASVLIGSIVVGGSLSSRNPSSVEVNETIVNYKTLNAKTMESKETALEQRLADVL